MNQVRLLSLLYDLSLTIGSESRVRPLLQRTLQRLLFHTNLPAGVVLQATPQGAKVVLALGDHRLSEREGQFLPLTPEWCRGPMTEFRQAPAFVDELAVLGDHGFALRLSIANYGAVVLLGPADYASTLPLTQLFQPALEQLSRALVLCAANEAHTAALELEHSETQKTLRMLSTVIEQSPTMVMITDLEWRLLYVNEALARNSGYSAAELLGRDPGLLHSARTPPQLWKEMRDELAAGRSWRGEFVSRRKDGTEVVIEAYLLPLRESAGSASEHATGFVGLMEDVTARRTAEQQLEAYRAHLEEEVERRTAELLAAKEDAEAANRAKSTFLANMSHEIRTPMNAIIGLTHLVRRDSTSPRHREQLDKVAASAQHLLSLINDVLDLSKIEAGKLTLEATDFEVERVVANVCSILSEKAADHGLTLVTQLDDVPSLLTGDRLRLGQVLLNFGSNAVKFTDHGNVTFRARTVSRSAGEVRVRFEVQDTGIGLADEQRDRLFQAFEQAEVSTTRRYGGTGLGLVISRRLAHLMGGEVGFESSRGKGSCFWLEAPFGLPTTQRPSRPPFTLKPDEAIELELARRRGHRVLVVDSLELNREVSTELLRASGLQPTAVADGEAAVAACQQHAWGLVLMDLQLPGIDGLEATRRIRRLPNHQQTPIVALTADAFDDDRRRCLDAGMNDHLSKPIDPDGLRRALVQWLPPRANVTPVARASPSAVRAATLTAAATRTALLTLRELVDQGDMSSHARFAELRPSLEQLSPERVEELARELGRFRYPQAMALIEALLAALPAR